MTPEQNIIQQINQQISNDLFDNPDYLETLASQYKQACATANQRLMRCAEYLEKGLLSEAVFEAKNAPGLLETAALLNFEASKKWRNICEDLELSQAPRLKMDIVDRVKNAMEREKELQPLLRKFRSLIYQGLASEAIPVLRKIRALDPDNESWKSNLQTYEEAELPFWLEKAEAALLNSDLMALREVYKELTDPYRVAAAPEALLDRLRRSLLADKAADLLLEAENLLQRLQEKIAAEEVDAVKKLILDSKKLADNEAFFRQPDSWSEQLSVAKLWLEKSEKEQMLEADFATELQLFKDFLAFGSFTEEELYQRWSHIKNWGRDISDDLGVKVNTELEKLRTQRLKKRRLRNVTISIVSLIVLILLFFSSYKLSQRRQYKDILEELQLDYDSAKFSDLREKLDNLQEYRPHFYKLPEIQSFVKKHASALSEEGERSKLVSTYFDRLEEIRRSEYQLTDDEIETLLAEATELPLLDSEKVRINNWKHSWQNWKAAQRRESNSAIQGLCNQFRSVRLSIQNLQEADFAFEREKIEEFRLLFQSTAIHLQRAEDIFRADYEQCLNQFELWQKDLQQRVEQFAADELQSKERQERLEKLVYDLFQSLPDLTLYASRLEQLRNFYDGRMPAEFSAALTNLELQRKALSLGNFSMRSFPCLPQQETELRAFLEEDSAALASVWEADIRRAVNYLDKQQDLKRKVRTLAIEQESMFQAYIIEIRKKDEEQWQRLYVPTLPSSREETDETGNKYLLYWGNIFYAHEADDIPEETHTSKIFPNGLNTMEYDVKIARKAQDSITEQGKFLLDFVMNSQAETELDIYIIDALQRLRNSAQNIEPVPRVWLQKRLINFLADNFSDDIPESLDWASDINKINTDVPWMNPRHPQVLAAEEQIKSQDEFFPDLELLRIKLKSNRELLARSLSRRIVCAGAMRRNDDGKLTPFLCIPPGGQLWVLNTASQQSTAFWQILSKDSDKMQNDVLRNTYEGQLIFAPSANFPTLNVPEEITDLHKPQSWPVNDDAIKF